MTSRATFACRVSATVFGLVFVLHVWRLISQTPVLIGTWPVPLGASWLALVVSGGLAWWVWRASQS